MNALGVARPAPWLRAAAACAAALSLVACQPAFRRVPKPEPVASLAVGEVRRASDHVATSNATWSPDGRWLAYGTDRGVVATDLRGEERRLADLPHATAVAWSPAGAWLAVLSGGRLWRLSASGGRPQPVPLPGVVRAVRWSPAGDRLAALVEERGSSLWLVSAQGNLRRRVFAAPEDSALVDPAWYPDGLYVFVRAEDRSGRTSGQWRVRVAGPDRQVVPVPFPRILEAHLAPHGRAVAYLLEGPEEATVQVQELGHRPRPPLARAERLSGLAWSPQGDKLSYAEVHGGERAVLWVVDADGGRRLRVADYTLEFPDPGAGVGTEWSPDGRALAFGASFLHRAGPVWVARLVRR
ncbi:Protein TolB [bacterium HR32]|nr:Protein TolB [bacterium HR32]